MLIQSNSRLLFIGNSITDCGRKRPIGSGGFDQALGNGYVSLVDAALAAVYPDFAISTINMGINGDTVHDLKYRWTKDVLELKPDWLSILIGINDVWQHINQLWQSEGQDPVDRFAETLDDLVGQVRPGVKGLLLMTPYFLEPDPLEPMRAMMDQFGAAMGDVADRHQALLVDSQAAFNPLIDKVNPLQLAMDRVHINLTGHMILAQAFLRKVGFSWDRKVN
jgi:lysophospholipase L1-like esterase